MKYIRAKSLLDLREMAGDDVIKIIQEYHKDIWFTRKMNKKYKKDCIKVFREVSEDPFCQKLGVLCIAFKNKEYRMNGFKDFKDVNAQAVAKIKIDGRKLNAENIKRLFD